MRRPNRAIFEPLESRTLLAGSPLGVSEASYLGGVQLRLQGTAAADAITVTRAADGGGLLVANGDGWSRLFDGSYKSLRIDAAAGNDSVTLDAVRRPRRRSCTAAPATTRSRAAAATTASTAGSAPTRSPAARATTCSSPSAAPPPTASPATPAATASGSTRAKTELVTDASAEELATGSVHRVGSYFAGTNKPEAARHDDARRRQGEDAEGAKAPKPPKAAEAGQARARQPDGPARPGPRRPRDHAELATGVTYQRFDDRPLFAEGGPSADDVVQGYVGDCYFLAVLSSVAQGRPDRDPRDRRRPRRRHLLRAVHQGRQERVPPRRQRAAEVRGLQATGLRRPGGAGLHVGRDRREGLRVLPHRGRHVPVDRVRLDGRGVLGARASTAPPPTGRPAPRRCWPRSRRTCSPASPSRSPSARRPRAATCSASTPTASTPSSPTPTARPPTSASATPGAPWTATRPSTAPTTATSPSPPSRRSPRSSGSPPRSCTSALSIAVRSAPACALPRDTAQQRRASGHGAVGSFSSTDARRRGASGLPRTGRLRGRSRTGRRGRSPPSRCSRSRPLRLLRPCGGSRRPPRPRRARPLVHDDAVVHAPLRRRARLVAGHARATCDQQQGGGDNRHIV